MNYDTITGEVKGFYLVSIHGENIPAPIMEITPEKHDFYMENNGKYRLNLITLEDELIPIVESPPQPKTPIEINAERITAAEDAINMILTML